jgi:hypothetical protein
MVNIMKKTFVSLLVVIGATTVAGAFASKVIIDRGCNEHGCHFSKRVVSHHHGEKIVKKVYCHNGHCSTIEKKIMHKPNGKVVIKKKRCDAFGCEKSKVKRWS